MILIKDARGGKVWMVAPTYRGLPFRPEPNEPMRKSTLILAAAATVAALGAPAASAADLPSFADAPPPAPPPLAWSPWLVRVRALGVLPDPGARLSAAGTPVAGASVAITDAVVPELDISYFFTRNVAAELILGVTRHGIQGAGTLAGARIGSTWILPPTLTLQYHFDGFGPLKPYVGAGVNYSIFFGEQERGGFTGFRLTNSVAPALQAGFDYMLDEHWGVNVDVKKLFLDTKVKLNAGTIRGRVDIDPWIVGAGITYRF